MAAKSPASENGSDKVPGPTDVRVGADIERAAKRSEHPMLAAVGAFEGDPSWDQVIEEMRRYRRRLGRAAGV